MVRKAGRRIGRKTVRQMLGLKHGEFRRVLRDIGERYGCRVLIVNEAYTSKTCSRCGWLHPKLRGAHTFCCGHCASAMPRDWNAARNILLRNAELVPALWPTLANAARRVAHARLATTNARRGPLPSAGRRRHAGERPRMLNPSCKSRCARVC